MEIKNVIVIDDDPINNHICHKYIQIVFPSSVVDTFTDPQKGLDYIYSKCDSSSQNDFILFLDINMPVLSGWDVLDRIMNLSEEKKKQLKIYILSSSVAAEDMQKANDNALVLGFIEKPLSILQLQTMFS